MKSIGEQLNDLQHSQWLGILVSERYDYNKLLKKATEQEFREGLFGENIFSTPIDVISVFNNYKLNKNFCRQIEANMNTERKEGIDKFVLSFFNNPIDTPYQPLFFTNCAMWVESTRMKWELDIERENIIKFFMVHAILLERNRI